jgi:hypothetical protein
MTSLLGCMFSLAAFSRVLDPRIIHSHSSQQQFVPTFLKTAAFTFAAPAKHNRGLEANQDVLEVVITADTPWVLNPNFATTTHPIPHNTSFSLALKDLRRDWYTIFGSSPITLGTYFPFANPAQITGLSPPYPVPTVDQSGTFLFLGSLYDLTGVLADEILQQVRAELEDAASQRIDPDGQGDGGETHGCFAYGPTANVQYNSIVCSGQFMMHKID